MRSATSSAVVRTGSGIYGAIYQSYCLNAVTSAGYFGRNILDTLYNNSVKAVDSITCPRFPSIAKVYTMPVTGFLTHTWAIVVFVVGLLSGAISILREVQLMY